jgi:hypothetical protein
MQEIIQVDNSDIINFMIDHDRKFVDLSLKNKTSMSPDNIKNLPEIKLILDMYRSKKYYIFTYVSGTEDPKKVLEKIVMNEFEKQYGFN